LREEFPAQRLNEDAVCFSQARWEKEKRGKIMLALKYLLLILGVGLLGSSGILVAYDIYIAARLRWLLEQTSGDPATKPVLRKAARPFGPPRWRLAAVEVRK
jgi:hypothetical protein